MHNYLYDYTFEHTAVYKKLKNLKEFNCTYIIYIRKKVLIMSSKKTKLKIN